MENKREQRFNFEKLEVYELSQEFALSVYDITKTWPREYLFDITSQFRRAALSISLNIAEGSSKTTKDFKRFIDIARGSCWECVAILDLASGSKLIAPSQFERFRDQLTAISKMLSGLKNSLVHEP